MGKYVNNTLTIVALSFALTSSAFATCEASDDLSGDGSYYVSCISNLNNPLPMQRSGEVSIEIDIPNFVVKPVDFTVMTY